MFQFQMGNNLGKNAVEFVGAVHSYLDGTGGFGDVAWTYGKQQVMVLTELTLLVGAAKLNYAEPLRPGKVSNYTDNEPLPPGWTDEWEQFYGLRNKTEGKHWWDPEMGEWRWHAPDSHHDTGHWDYNPWDEFNSEWQNLYPPYEE